MNYANIMSRLLDSPLWAHPLKAAAIYNALCGRFGTGALELDGPEASRFVGDWPPAGEDGHDGNGRRSRSEPFRLTPKGVGIVSVTGTLVNRGAWIGSHSGLTSYEGIKHQLQRAAADSRVKSIILDLDTPGGEANGAFEAAQAVRSAASRKPVIAVSNGMAASAGYALASGATKIITTPSGLNGSIGCVMLHLDMSRAMENEGIRPTLIVAGAHKADGNAVEPLSPDTAATLQREVDRYYDLFIDTVVAGRGRATPASVARSTEGRTYIGREAVDARLADDVGTFEEVLGDLTRRAGRVATSSNTRAERGDTQARKQTMEPLLEDEMREGAVEGRSVAAQERPHVALAESKEPMIRLLEASTQADGEALQIARFNALLEDPRVQGKERVAFKIACGAPDMTADRIGSICAEMPAASPRLSLAERVRETGADAITSATVPEDRNQTAKGWDDAIAKANARTQAAMPRRGRN